MRKQIYMPEPGSVPYKILSFFHKNPDEELTRRDIAVKFDLPAVSVDETLLTARIYGAITAKNEEAGAGVAPVARNRSLSNKLIMLYADKSKSRLW